MTLPTTVTPELLSTWLPPRPAAGHKGDFGSVGVLGGAPGMAGAALLAGRAALWAGAGRVYCGLLDTRVAVDPAAPELMLCAPERLLQLRPPGCLVAGPGLGLSGEARGWLLANLSTPLPLLLDADALNLLAAEPDVARALAERSAPTLLTPHPGEAARLLGWSVGAVQADRPAALGALLERYRVGVALKGAGTLVGFPGGGTWRNTTGNPGMAAPGMGDVLAGLLAALVAQGLAIERAAVFAVHLHGAAADQRVGAGIGPLGLTATEVAWAARDLLNRWRAPTED